MRAPQERPRRGRPPDRREEIEAELRAKIVHGAFPGGSRLPSRKALVAHYGTSNTAVQAVMRALEADGFIVSRDRAGTVVNPDPPFRKRYALLFSFNPSDAMSWTLYAERLRQQAAALGADAGCSVDPYYGIESGAATDYRRLVEDITHYRLAGVIYTTLRAPPELLELAKGHGTPAVALSSDALYGFFGANHGPSDLVASAVFSYRSFFRAALSRLVEAGRRRPALLLPPGMMRSMEATVRREIARLGLDLPPYHIQYAPTGGGAAAARNIVHVTMRRDAPGAPDALVVADDNLLPDALLGLQDAGVRVGEDADVIAHANFPLSREELDGPVVRIGFDLRAALEQSVQLARQWRETGRRPGPVALRAEEGSGAGFRCQGSGVRVQVSGGRCQGAGVRGQESASHSLSP
jgi:GntR family transcriptional regulator